MSESTPPSDADDPGDVPVESGRGRRSKTVPRKSSPARMIAETAITVVAALVISLLIKTFVMQPFFIPSESMYNTMLKDDKFMVSKLSPKYFDIKRGDIVVFKAPASWMDETVIPDSSLGAEALAFLGIVPQDLKDHWVKRVIGLPGDNVRCCNNGKLIINGVEIDEPYLYPGARNELMPFQVTIRPGHIWVQGDNRERSEDSRYQLLVRGVDGQLPMDSIVGKAKFIYWPASRWSGLESGESAFAGVPAATAP